VAWARRNLEPVGGQVYAGDLYEPLPGRLRGRVSVIAANVPYVPTEAVALMPPEARVYEPPVALDGGPDGLDVVRRAAAGAAAWLMPGGHVLIETASGQADTAAAAFTAAGLAATVARDAELGPTVVIGRR
jgi:release factor glutamine methyltransferase